MQATVYRFDPATGSGSMLSDDGVVLSFGPDALELSGLRHLRPGQRLSVERVTDDAGRPGPISALTLGTIGSELRAASQNHSRS